MTRTRVAHQSVTAGCDRCGARWTKANAHGLAVQHTDKVKHPTWVEQVLRIEYGCSDMEPQQRGLF